MGIQKLKDIRFAVEWHTGGDVWDAFAWFTNCEEAEEYIDTVWRNSRQYRIIPLEGAGND